VYLGVDLPALHFAVSSYLDLRHYLKISEFLFIISHILLYPYIVRAIQRCLNTSSIETFFDFPQFEISDLWDSLTEEEYIKDILENSSDNTDTLDCEPKQFDIFQKLKDNYIGHHYLSGGMSSHFIVLHQ
jgi:hypothetical protein